MSGSGDSLVGWVIAAGVTLVVSIAAASPHGYWLDGNEFVAASTWLGIAHPPGQPLAVLLGYVCTLVPIGSLAFRVAIASSLVAALAVVFLFRAIEGTLAVVGVSTGSGRAPLALAGTLLLAGSTGFLFQAVRPEVYALQAALVFFVLDQLVRFHRSRPAQDWRPLYLSAVALGLAITNHHFLAFLLLPAVAPAWAIAFREGGLRPLGVGGALATLGATGYAYLPARAAAAPLLNLGDPDSLSRFYWVVSAEVYQKNQGTGVPEPMIDRFLDVAVRFHEEFHLAAIVAALVGAYVVLRIRRARGVGLLWVTVLVVFAAARGWLGFVRSNPDATGYLLPAFGALVALATAALAALLTVLAPLIRRARLTRVFWLLPAACLAVVWQGTSSASLAAFSDSDAFCEAERRTLPARAVLFVQDPQTAFRLFGAQATMGFRPDVTVVPFPFVGYPGVVNQLAQSEPLLTPVLRDVFHMGYPTVSAMQDIPKQRPLFLQLGARTPASTYRTLVPSYSYFSVLDSDAYDEDRRPGRLQQDKGWQLLEGLLPPSPDFETKRKLLWRSYHEALYFASVGKVEAATLSAERGLALFPETRLRDLVSALSQVEEGTPLDIEPFMLNERWP